MTQNGVVSSIETGDHIVYKLCAKVVWRSELDGERYLAKRY